jgi:competence protein ComEA
MRWNSNLKRRIIEISVVFALSCIIFLACNLGPTNNDIVLSEGFVEEESDRIPTEFSSDEEPEEVVIVVYVCGEVLNPGLYSLPEGSRIGDAVEAAGGFTSEAVTDAVNLADFVHDGDMVRIPRPGEEVYTGNEASDGKVNINTAGVTELCAIPGIGEARAKAIISYREKNGPFEICEDLMKVSGIKAGMYERMKEYVKVK